MLGSFRAETFFVDATAQRFHIDTIDLQTASIFIRVEVFTFALFQPTQPYARDVSFPTSFVGNRVVSKTAAPINEKPGVVRVYGPCRKENGSRTFSMPGRCTACCRVRVTSVHG